MATNKPIPVTVTRVRSVDIAPSQEVVTPIRPLTPGDLRELLASLKQSEGHLGTQAQRIRIKLRECRATPEEQQAALRTFLEQAEPGYELKQLVSHATTMWSAYEAFEQALTEARSVHARALELMARCKGELSRLQETDIIQLEHREAMTRALGPVSYATVQVGILLDGTRALGQVARESAARLVHAAGLVGREWELQVLTGRLRRVQQVTETIRSEAQAYEDRLGILVAEVAEQLQMSMAIPRLVWGAADKPFAPPVLKG